MAASCSGSVAEVCFLWFYYIIVRLYYIKILDFKRLKKVIQNVIEKLLLEKRYICFFHYIMDITKFSPEKHKDLSDQSKE